MRYKQNQKNSQTSSSSSRYYNRNLEKPTQVKTDRQKHKSPNVTIFSPPLVVSTPQKLSLNTPKKIPDFKQKLFTKKSHLSKPPYTNNNFSYPRKNFNNKFSVPSNTPNTLYSKTESRPKERQFPNSDSVRSQNSSYKNTSETKKSLFHNYEELPLPPFENYEQNSELPPYMAQIDQNSGQKNFQNIPEERVDCQNRSNLGFKKQKRDIPVETELPTYPMEEKETKKRRLSAGNLLLSCWCGDTFMDTVSAFSHCRDSHEYSAFLLLHRTLAQLLSSDHSDSSTSVPSIIKKDKKHPKSPLDQGKEEEISTKLREERTRKLDEKKMDNREREGDFVSVQNSPKNENSKLKNLKEGVQIRGQREKEGDFDRNLFSKVWLYDPKDPSRFVCLSDKTIDWKESLSMLREKGWDWGKGPYGNKYPNKSITNISKLFPSKNKRDEVPRYKKSNSGFDSPYYMCPGCNITGSWPFIRSHLRTSGHLIGGAKCTCGYLCIVKECIREHFLKSNRRDHYMYVGTLYTASEFLMKNPYQEPVVLDDDLLCISRVGKDQYIVKFR